MQNLRSCHLVSFSVGDKKKGRRRSVPSIVLKVGAIMGGSVGCLQKKIEEMRGKERRKGVKC